MKVTDRHFLSADHKNHIHVKIWEPEGNVQCHSDCTRHD